MYEMAWNREEVREAFPSIFTYHFFDDIKLWSLDTCRVSASDTEARHLLQCGSKLLGLVVALCWVAYDLWCHLPIAWLRCLSALTFSACGPRIQSSTTPCEALEATLLRRFCTSPKRSGFQGVGCRQRNFEDHKEMVKADSFPRSYALLYLLIHAALVLASIPVALL